MAEGKRLAKQNKKRHDELEDDWRQALGEERRGQLEEGYVGLLERRRQAQEEVVGIKKGKWRRGSQ